MTNASSTPDVSSTSNQGGDQVSSEVVGLCQDLIRIDTTNYGPGESKGEREAAEYVAEKLSDAGLDPQIHESAPGRANLLARWDGTDPDLPPLLLHGHLDVVPANPRDWKVDPFSGEVADGCVWGRGAVDMKDMDAMILSVVRARARAGRPPRRTVQLAFTADEEAGGTYGARWLADNHPDALADCTEAVGEVGGFSLTLRDDLRLYLLETAEKGIAWIRLKAKGTAGHGSMRNPDNAITELAEAVARIGRYDWPLRHTATVTAFLAELSRLLETDLDYETCEAEVAKLGGFARMFGAVVRNSANPTKLEAGYKENVIPAEASAVIDGRFLPGYEDEFYATLDSLIGDRVTRETIIDDVALEVEFAGDIVDAMRASITAEDAQASFAPLLMSGGTDAKAWSRLGIKGYGFAPLQLPPDLDFLSLFHGVDERVPVESLEFGCRVLDRFLDLA